MINPKLERFRQVRYRPHIIRGDQNPFGGGVSGIWRGLLAALIILEVDVIGAFLLTLNHDIIFKLWMFNAVSFICVIAFIAIPTLWLWFFGNQKRLDNTIEKILFNKRLKKGFECLSVFDGKITDANIRSVTGIIGCDQETGLFRSQVNEVKNQLTQHPYRGNWFMTYNAKINFSETNSLLVIENLYGILKTIPEKHYVNVIWITSETTKNAIKDITNLLKEKDLRKPQERALYSLYNKYSGQNNLREAMCIIHIGLPFTVHKETAIKNMIHVQNHYIKALNEKKIDTEQIKDPYILSAIIKGALTGQLHMVGGLHE